MTPLQLLFYPWLLALISHGNVLSAKPYNSKMTFTDANVINFADPLIDGFRVILSEEFLKHRVNRLSLSTLYISAIPLREGEPRLTKVLYPDGVREDNQVVVKGLREKSWYYICIDWESFGRHNETMGTSCKLFRTLDRQAQTSTNTVVDVQRGSTTDGALGFKLKVDADFPLRITAYLTEGAAATPAQNFFVRRPQTIAVFFPLLLADTDYGKLCILEEPLPQGYTAMGRLIKPELKEKCYFKQLRTNPRLSYAISDQPDNIRAYPRVATGGVEGLRQQRWWLWLVAIVLAVTLLRTNVL